MSDDPDTPNSKKPKKAAPDNGRDKRGRWKKGHCPNPKGRPKKERFKDYDPANPRHFFLTMIEVNTADGPQLMDRRAALLHKTYENAMKGGVTAQRMAWEMIKENDRQIAELRNRYEQRLFELVVDNPDFKSMDESLTKREHLELLGMASTLNHYFPGQYGVLLGEAEPDNPTDRGERLKGKRFEQESEDE